MNVLLSASIWFLILILGSDGLSPGVFAAVSDLGLHQGSFVPESEES
jgi:hypothetical protein